VPYLRGVSCPDKGEKHGHGVGFCQHGARVFATQGRTYEEILKHYYQGITLGPAPTG
jgi:stage II sporulation protein D